MTKAILWAALTAPAWGALAWCWVIASTAGL